MADPVLIWARLNIVVPMSTDSNTSVMGSGFAILTILLEENSGIVCDGVGLCFLDYLHNMTICAME